MRYISTVISTGDFEWLGRKTADTPDYHFTHDVIQSVDCHSVLMSQITLLPTTGFHSGCHYFLSNLATTYYIIQWRETSTSRAFPFAHPLEWQHPWFLLGVDSFVCKIVCKTQFLTKKKKWFRTNEDLGNFVEVSMSTFIFCNFKGSMKELICACVCIFNI